MLYIKFVTRVNPESSHCKYFFFFNFVLSDEVNQIIIQDTLNLYSDVCQLYLNKPKRNKEQNKAWHIKHKKIEKICFFL